MAALGLYLQNFSVPKMYSLLAFAGYRKAPGRLPWGFRFYKRSSILSSIARQAYQELLAWVCSAAFSLLRWSRFQYGA
jgi:hypothetical protein